MGSMIGDFIFIAVFFMGLLVLCLAINSMISVFDDRASPEVVFEEVGMDTDSEVVKW